MAPRIKEERNKLIIKLKDKKGWTFKAIAKEMRLKSKSSVHEIYNRYKNKIVRVKKLSTG